MFVNFVVFFLVVSPTFRLDALVSFIFVFFLLSSAQMLKGLEREWGFKVRVFFKSYVKEN